jgi:hypothetical protein
MLKARRAVLLLEGRRAVSELTSRLISISGKGEIIRRVHKVKGGGIRLLASSWPSVCQ